MNSVNAIAVSGMRVAEEGLEVSARDVAAADVGPTDEEVAAAFAALRADDVGTSGGGIAMNVRPVKAENADVDLANEAIRRTIARYQLAANAKVMRAAARMQKSVIDTLV